MAARAARPATVIELPTVLAAPLNWVIGELVADGGITAPVDAAATPEEAAVPEAATAPAAPTTGTLTEEPGVGGSLPDGDADPDAPDSPLDGELEPELGEPVEPASAAVGVAVTVT